MGVLVGGKERWEEMRVRSAEKCGPELSDTEKERKSSTWIEEMWHVLVSQKR